MQGWLLPGMHGSLPDCAACADEKADRVVHILAVEDDRNAGAAQEALLQCCRCLAPDQNSHCSFRMIVPSRQVGLLHKGGNLWGPAACLFPVAYARLTACSSSTSLQMPQLSLLLHVPLIGYMEQVGWWYATSPSE